MSPSGQLKSESPAPRPRALPRWAVWFIRAIAAFVVLAMVAAALEWMPFEVDRETVTSWVESAGPWGPLAVMVFFLVGLALLWPIPAPGGDRRPR